MPRKKAPRSPSARLQVRYELRKTAVDAVRSGDSVETVARVLKTSVRAVFNWLADYRGGGYDALREGHRSGRPRKVSPEVMRWLYDAITMGDPRQHQFAFCLWTLGIVRSLLKKAKGVDLSKSGVSRLLRHLGLSPQVPVYRSYKQDPKALDRYLKETFPEVRRLARRTGAEIYFVDEAAVRSDAHRGTTWGKEGETLVVEDSGDRFGMNMISAVSPRGDMRFATFEGRMNSARFIRFLKKLRKDAGRRIIVILDNAGYHKSGAVKRFAVDTKGEVTLEYLPPYAPELNPDEQVWNQAKARLSKLYIASKDQMKVAMLSILRSLQATRDLVRSFFQLATTQYAVADDG